jgi:DNA-binding MarR family transcriptional regulator
MSDPLDQIRSICLAPDDLYREMLQVAQTLTGSAEDCLGQCEYSIRESDPLWLRAILEHGDAGRLEWNTMPEDSNSLLVRYGSELADWWSGQLANLAPAESSSISNVQLKEGEWQILQLLRKSAHKATFQDELAAQTRLSRWTLSRYLDRLRSMNLVHRPRGERGGESLTEAGRRFIDHHDVP